jgi:translation initiation factor IF-2
MSEASEQSAKKPLRLNRPGRLELKKTVETGQVRQSFSHGRSKTVTVEVKKKRTFAPGAGGGMAEVKEALPHLGEAPQVQPLQPEVAFKGGEPRALTDAERAARARALESAKHEPEQPAPEIVARAPEAVEAPAAPVEPAPVAAEAEKPLSAEEEARRRTDEEARKLAEEAIGKPATTPVGFKPVARPKAAETVEEEEEAGDEVSRGKRGRAEVKRPAVAPKRTEPRRRGGKLTITQALEHGDGAAERVRSLASVRRAREKEKLRNRLDQPQEHRKVVREVIVPETISVQELANRMAERGADVIKALMKMGVMVTITQSIDADTAELVATEFGHKVKRVAEADVELGIVGEPDIEESLKPRPPVVTIMGHVDHGKTSLLDALRQTDVAAHEAGGITQHIGAYQVQLPSGARITFLDTPGHEAFTAMRARGAQVTDIVVLVVAADDSVQPQTVEAINHAKAAQVPIIVAINKIDRPDAKPDRVRQDLLKYEIVVEQLGGDTQNIEVSAKEKIGLDKLEEAILLQAEVLELAANPERPAQGAVVEAKLERGRGPVATVLVQRGTLKVGDILIAGAEWGRVRALIDDRGQTVERAGPSEPVEVLGLNAVPSAGDDFAVVENEGRAREISEYRQRLLRTKAGVAAPRATVEQMFTDIAAGAKKELAVVIKGDVQGSVEAMLGTIAKMATDEVSVRVLHSGVGGINESDVALAGASKGIVIGFNVRANRQARDLAHRDGTEIRYYSIIYDMVDDMKARLSGMLAPTLRERFLGTAEIRQVFTITKVGKVAGCMVTQGEVRRGAKVRLLRDDVVIHEGKLSSLKRFKDEVREVKEGYECGMAFENYSDIKEGDIVECYEIEEVARTL